MFKESKVKGLIEDSAFLSKHRKEETVDEILTDLHLIHDKKKNLIKIFDLEGESSSDEIANKIFNAFLESQKDNSFEIFKLALQWDRIDVVNKSDIFSGSDGLEPSQMEKLLEISLVENKPEFVRLLLDNGTNLTNFLTLGRFYYLYNSKQVV